MTETKLSYWYNDENGIYTCDEWLIPEEGTEIWCTAWHRGQTIKPYGGGMHIYVGMTVYHVDEFMGILQRNVNDGYKWGIENVECKRRQRINGDWEYINKKTKTTIYQTFDKIETMLKVLVKATIKNEYGTTQEEKDIATNHLKNFQKIKSYYENSIPFDPD